MSRWHIEPSGETKMQHQLSFPNVSLRSDAFHFGLEGEFLLVSLPSYKPLWHHDLSFSRLNHLLESIQTSDVGGDVRCFDIEKPHAKAMPFLVEGYMIPDDQFEGVDIQPKGIEIRTPVFSLIQACLEAFKQLHTKLQQALQTIQMKAISLSHHPTESDFEGEINKRRYDFWLWAKEVMSTYGPDINISIPTSVLENFCIKDFDMKVNYYAPSMTAVSLASPFLSNKIWEPTKGQPGRSFRTYKRSVVAPAIEYHADENNRLEFKVFEMSPYLVDYENYFLMCLTLLLSDQLVGRASNRDRIYAMGEVAKHGLMLVETRDRLEKLLSAARNILPKYGFKTDSLCVLEKRLTDKQVFADELIHLYQKTGQMETVLKYLSELK